VSYNSQPGEATAGRARWERVERLFWDALEIPLDKRAAFLESATGDEQLRRSVQRLLEAHQSATTRLGLNLSHLRPSTATEPPILTLQPGDVLAGRYELVRLLGQGGMGRVYEAEDKELGEIIAIKTVQPYGESVEQAYERLKRELRLMRRLTHINICRVFDIAREQTAGRDILFFTMELLRGGTIADRLKAEGKLPLTQVAPLVPPLVSALETAHANGIVHRDLKPGNIMLVESAGGAVRPVIMDFGIAGVVPLPNMTVTSSLYAHDHAGTPPYMAPEQLLGKPVTGAADFYSLGLVLYEMLCGQSPFGSTPLEAMFRRIEEAPADPRTYVPDLPEDWAKLILKWLDRDPGRRPCSSKAVTSLSATPRSWSPARVLRRSARKIRPGWAIPIAIALPLLASTFWWVGRSASHPATLTRVAMLPFTAAEPANDRDDVSARGFSEELSRRLAALVPSNAVTWIPADEVAGQHVADIASARKQLGADRVVTGSLAHGVTGVRTELSVADGRTGKILHSLGVEAPDYDGLLLLSSERVLRELGIRAGGSVTPATADRLAEADYIESLGFLERNDKPQALDQAAAALNRALSRDPNSVQARTQLAHVLGIQYERLHDPAKLTEAEHQLDRAAQIAPGDAAIPFARGELYVATGRYAEALDQLRAAQGRGLRTSELFVALAKAYNGVGLTDQAESSYRQAIRANPQSWSAYSYLAQFYYRRGLYQKSAEEFQEALRLTPDNARVLYSLGGVLLQLGRFPESREYLLKAAALNPSAPVWINLGGLHVKLKQWAEAAAYYEKALELDPSNYRVWASLADGYAHLPGQNGKSQDAYRRAAELCRRQLGATPGDGHLAADLAFYLAQTGNRQEALELIERALALVPSDAVVMVTASEIYELLGFRTEALDWVKNALQHGFPREGLEGDQSLDALRSDARYVAIAAQPARQKK
jgi:serine/threonine protein kinase/tetratricopeptide (TPR) repeat protein